MSNKNEIKDAEIIEDIESEAESEPENPDAVEYEIIDGDQDGVKKRGVRANGNVIFLVSESFTNDQINEVFNLGNKFFNDGMQFSSIQQDNRIPQALAMLGITPKVIKQMYDLAVLIEEKEAAEASDTKEAA
ncbi:MAG: hypothetical protein GY804_06585 [Alphaproteobacteria bacterium]|nr:hypothetical protein [Alphaproteobacteria bacterium]